MGIPFFRVVVVCSLLAASNVHASQFDGAYFGGTLGLNSSAITGSTSAPRTTTRSLGLQEGYNWDVNNVLVGINYFADFNHKHDLNNLTSKLGSVVYGLDLKVGIPNGNSLPYVKLGWARSIATGTYIPAGIIGKQNGLHWAIGYEYKLNSNWSVAADLSGSSVKKNGATLDNKNMMVSLNYYIGKLFTSDANGFTLSEPKSSYPASSDAEPVEISLPPLESAPTQVAELTSPIATSPSVIEDKPMTQQQVWKTLREEKPIVLYDASFAFGSANLSNTVQHNLRETVKFAHNNRDSRLNVTGHTDSIGSDAYNQQLSERRALSVKQFLIKEGVEANRIYTIGHGETDPIADNKTKAGRAKNRRVEIRSVITEEKKVRAE